MSRSSAGIVLWALVLAPLQNVWSKDDCGAAAQDCVAVGHWNFSIELGLGERTDPLVNSKSIPLVVIPQFSYYGKRFFLDDLDLGFTVAETDSNSFNLIASPGYDRVYFYRSDLQNVFVSGLPFSSDAVSVGGIPANHPPTLAAPNAPAAGSPSAFPPRSRRITYLAGPEWTFKYAGVTGQLDVLHEITDQNQGNEVRAAVRAPLLRADGGLTATLGFTWNSAAIVNYYYGAANVYTGGSAFDPFVKLAYSRPFAKRWRFNAFAEYERLAGAIADSPIVAEHHVATVFVGCAYTF